MSALRLALLLGLSCAVLAEEAPRLDFAYGEARDRRSGALLYSEWHYKYFENGRHSRRTVFYRCPDGGDFARKSLDGDGDPLAPSFLLEDRRADYTEGLRRLEGDQLEVFTGQSASVDRAHLAAPEGLVADAGFDEFVRSNWQQLDQGLPVRLPFLLPFRLEHAEFRARKLASSETAGVPTSTFRLSVTGFIGLFVSPIDVSYRRDSRELMRYEGVTNIRDARGNNIDARIEFAPDRRRQHVAETELQDALARPLVTSCGA